VKRKTCRLVSMALAGVLALSLAACGGERNAATPAPTSAAPAVNGTPAGTGGYASQIVIGTLSDPTYIDPNAPGVGPSEINVTQQIYEGLVRTAEDGSIQPLLAEDWGISEDALTYTFNLKPGIKFSDGTAVTGDDWIWSLYRARDYETSNYRFIAEAIDTVEATDSQVVITLKYPWAPFLADLANFNMVVGSKAHWDAVGDEAYLNDPLGTGPYMVKEWNRGQSLILEANPYYHEAGYPKTPEIKYTVVSDDNTRLMQLQSGQIDVVGDLPFSVAPIVEADPSLNLDVFPSTQIRYLILNTTKPPFDDVKVRQALYYALNKQEMATAVAGQYGESVAALVSSTQGKWSNGSLKVTDYAPDTAKQMLSDAGYTQPVQFTLSIRSGSTVYEQIATLIKSQVDKAGFDCQIEMLEKAAISDKYTSLSHQATILQWVDDIEDPSGITGWTVDYDQCDAWYTGLNDAELDQLNTNASMEMDEAKRVEMYQEIQQRIYDNANVIPLFSNGFAYASSKKVEGLYVSPFYVYQAMNWTKSE
jgi:peptide/nickel transport system substrate-binding protein